MKHTTNAFTVTINNKPLDYRLGNQLDISAVRKFFERNYHVHTLWNAGRHIVGVVEKNNQHFFLKLATTEGISVLTKNEYYWNQSINSLLSRDSNSFWVPNNIDSGMYNSKLFYLVTEYFHLPLLAPGPGKRGTNTHLQRVLNDIITTSEVIQQLDLPEDLFIEEIDFTTYFINKTSTWYEMIPDPIKETYDLSETLGVIKKYASLLNKSPRHGDFTPWHLMKKTNDRLILIDGEHAKSNGVEYYDIAYFIQRVFSELQAPEFAQQIVDNLLQRRYNKEKLTLVLKSRAIGGFLDESLKQKPNYQISNSFLTWVKHMK